MNKTILEIKDMIYYDTEKGTMAEFDENKAKRYIFANIETTGKDFSVKKSSGWSRDGHTVPTLEFYQDGAYIGYIKQNELYTQFHCPITTTLEEKQILKKAAVKFKLKQLENG